MLDVSTRQISRRYIVRIQGQTTPTFINRKSAVLWLRRVTYTKACFVFFSDINPFGLCAVKSKLYLKRYRKKNMEDHFQLVSVHLPSDGIRS